MMSHLSAEVLTLAIGMPTGWEWIIILVIGLLLFGKRLPEVGRSLGRGIVEFKKGIKSIDDDIEEESSPRPPAPSSRSYLSDQPKEEPREFKRKEPTAAKSTAVEPDDNVD